MPCSFLTQHLSIPPVNDFLMDFKCCTLKELFALYFIPLSKSQSQSWSKCFCLRASVRQNIGAGTCLQVRLVQLNSVFVFHPILLIMKPASRASSNSFTLFFLFCTPKHSSTPKEIRFHSRQLSSSVDFSPSQSMALVPDLRCANSLLKMAQATLLLQKKDSWNCYVIVIPGT